VLKALRPITVDTVDEKNRARSVHGRFCPAAGPVPGYLEEEGGSTSSTTETFVALRVDIDNWRWADVPFICVPAKG